MTRVARVLPALAALSLTAAAASQSTMVFPPAYGNRPGNSLDQEPFGLDQIRHVTVVDAAYTRALPVGSMLKELRYRRDEERLDKIFSNLEPMRRDPTVIPRWQISIGATTARRDRLTPTYPANLTTVFAGALDLLVNTPTLSPPASPSVAAPFAMRFPFFAPWRFPGGALIVDHFCYETRNRQHNYYVDSVETTQTNGGTVDLISPTSLGCPANFNRVHGSAPNPGGGAVDLHLFGAPAKVPVLCFFGAGTTSWNGLSLPHSLVALGMASCNIYTDLSAAVPAQTDVAGIASLSFPVPANAQLLGLSLFNQWGVTDQRVNPGMGFAMSDGVKITLGTTLGAETVLMSVISGEASRANVRTGYLQHGRGPVFQILY